MRTTVPKKLFAHPRSAKGQLAKALSISLYPSHRSILAEREKQYGVPKSILLQVLLDEEVQNGLLGPALEARLIASNNRALAERLKTKETKNIRRKNN